MQATFQLDLLFFKVLVGDVNASFFSEKSTQKQKWKTEIKIHPTGRQKEDKNKMKRKQRNKLQLRSRRHCNCLGQKLWTVMLLIARTQEVISNCKKQFYLSQHFKLSGQCAWEIPRVGQMINQSACIAMSALLSGTPPLWFTKPPVSTNPCCFESKFLQLADDWKIASL